MTQFQVGQRVQEVQNGYDCIVETVHHDGWFSVKSPFGMKFQRHWSHLSLLPPEPTPIPSMTHEPEFQVGDSVFVAGVDGIGTIVSHEETANAFPPFRVRFPDGRLRYCYRHHLTKVPKPSSSFKPGDRVRYFDGRTGRVLQVDSGSVEDRSFSHVGWPLVVFDDGSNLFCSVSVLALIPTEVPMFQVGDRVSIGSDLGTILELGNGFASFRSDTGLGRDNIPLAWLTFVSRPTPLLSVGDEVEIIGPIVIDQVDKTDPIRPYRVQIGNNKHFTWIPASHIRLKTDK